MVEITNPSSVLLTEREDNPPGSVIVASLEGTRPILVEIQALTATTVFGMPRRTAYTSFKSHFFNFFNSFFNHINRTNFSG